jgi:hypothetical protein
MVSFREFILEIGHLRARFRPAKTGTARSEPGKFIRNCPIKDLATVVHVICKVMIPMAVEYLRHYSITHARGQLHFSVIHTPGIVFHHISAVPRNSMLIRLFKRHFSDAVTRLRDSEAVKPAAALRIHVCPPIWNTLARDSGMDS